MTRQDENGTVKVVRRSYTSGVDSTRYTSGKVTVRRKNAVAVQPDRTAYVYTEHSGVVDTFKGWVYTAKVKDKSQSCFDKVVTVLIFAVLLFFVAGSYCEYLGTFNEIKDIESEISESRDRQNKLLVAIEQRDNELGIDEYATEVLCMVKSDKVTRHYVNISERDTVTGGGTDYSGEAPEGVLLSGFKSILSNVVK